MLKQLFAISFAVVALPACNSGNAQVTANKVLVGTLLATPAVNVSAGAFFSGDAGTLDGGNVALPGTTQASVFFGSRTSQSLDVTPDPITGAQVSLKFIDGGSEATLPVVADGVYAADGGLIYAAGATYLFTAQLNGEQFVGKVENAPAAESISAFHPVKGWVQQNANTPFTFARPDGAANQPRNLGFVTVFPLDSQGNLGVPTYTNAPSSVSDVLKVGVAPADFKTSPVTIPGSAFPQPGSTYLVVFHAVQLGGPETDNLFLGSTLLAGTADTAVVRTN